jgi:hypothetical protein
MRPHISYISLRNLDILSQLKVEECLLRHCTKNYILFSHSPLLTVSSIVLGFSGKKDVLVNIDAVKAFNVVKPSLHNACK